METIKITINKTTGEIFVPKINKDYVINGKVITFLENKEYKETLTKEAAEALNNK